MSPSECSVSSFFLEEEEVDEESPSRFRMLFRFSPFGKDDMLG
jgi:hypothetical protein